MKLMAVSFLDKILQIQNVIKVDSFTVSVTKESKKLILKLLEIHSGFTTNIVLQNFKSILILLLDFAGHTTYPRNTQKIILNQFVILRYIHSIARACLFV